MLEITRAVVNAVHTPVTAKTRLGWDETDLHPRVNPLGLNRSVSPQDGLSASAVCQCNGLSGEAGLKSTFIVDLAEALQDCGITELAIHGRTRSQMYRGEADWTLIGEVRNNPRMHIPVIGNGDVCTPERARECFERYGVDAIMVGRATFGNPWLFAEMRAALCPESPDNPDFPVTMSDKVAVLKEHVLASIQWCGNDERKGIIHSRRHFAASPVFKGLADFKQTRIALLRAETLSEVFAIMDSIVAQWGPLYQPCMVD
jgi:tRNA-dihydrouridine synthase